jgi:hypothetical protein
VLLDSHSEIAALPESPWLLGTYGTDFSLRSLLEDLVSGPFGVVKNVSGVAAEDVYAAGRRFLEELFAPVLRKSNKRIVVFKTPDDIRYLDFLVTLLPDARYIHITRDGRDVAMSQLAKKGSFFKELRSFGQVTYANTLRRWVDWEKHIRATLYRPGIEVVHLRYEDLVTAPGRELQRITAFIGVPFEEAAIDYAARPHDYPQWEAGSTDVARHSSISTDSIGTWQRIEPTTEMLYALRKHDAYLVSVGYRSSNLALSLRQRAATALFGLVTPVVSRVTARWQNWRGWLRAQLSGVLCATATLAMALLAAQMLAPLPLLEELHLAGHFPQAVLGAVAVLCFEAVFWPELLRRSTRPRSNLPTLSKAMLFMLGYVGLLDLGQLVIPDRHPQLGDVLADLAIVVAVTALTLLPLRWAQQRLWPA